jgi:hypothetical protein
MGRLVGIIIIKAKPVLENSTHHFWKLFLSMFYISKSYLVGFVKKKMMKKKCSPKEWCPFPGKVDPEVPLSQPHGSMPSVSAAGRMHTKKQAHI